MTTTTTATSSDNLGPNAKRLQEHCPGLLGLLSSNKGKELLAVLDMETAGGSSPNVTALPSTDIPWYWHQVHLMLIFRTLVSRTSTELALAVMKRHDDDPRPNNDLPFAEATPRQLTERLGLLQDLLQMAEDKLVQWEQAEEKESEETTMANSETTSDSKKKQQQLPLSMGLLAKAYEMKPVEKLVFQFLVTSKTQPGPTVLNLVMPQAGHDGFPTGGTDDDQAYKSAALRYICGVTAMYWSTLANEDHELCKDRVLVLTQEEYGTDKMLTVSEEVCRALFGWPLKSEDKLKLSGTKMLQLIQPDGADDGLMMMDDTIHNNNEDATDGDGVEDTMAILGRLSLRGNEDMVKELAKLEDVTKSTDTLPSVDEASKEEEAGQPVTSAAADDDSSSTASSEDKTKPKPYTSELEYLQQYFEIVMYKVVYSRQRVQQELRNASLGDNKPSWMRSAAENSNSKFSIGEMSAKIRMGRRKMQLSLELTRKAGTFYPRLEILARQLQLDEFHKFVLVFLAGAMISPIFKSCINGDDSYGDKTTKVGDLLVVYFETFAEQVSNRTYFYRSSKLLRKGLIKFVENYSQLNDLTDQELKLDRRVLDCIVGLDKESSEISHGSHLYEPKVSLDAVVLPGALKDTITKAVTHFEQFRTYRKSHPDFDEAIAYGVGLTLMFCGKSGTGKTMTANAIAARLGKKLLLVNFPLLNQKNEKDGETSKYQSIFREAELSDAIIFFDECESLFSQRSHGGSSETTELLTELERFEGIVFLATNRPFDLDEAMYRRISEVFEFKPPNYLERLDIWKLVTSHEAVPCDPSIDWESIALNYELTGGFIKNAVIAGLLDAVGRDPHSPCVTEADILEGCKKQVRGALQMVEFNERVVPRGGISDLVLSDSVLEKINEIVNLEKARAILFGNWGFDQDMRSRQGTTSLFWGPSGTGRSRAAEAIGFELGKPLKVVDLPRLLSERKGSDASGFDPGAKTVRNVFHEARLMDAVLVLDGFSLDTEGGSGGASADAHLLNLVMREMTRFPGVVIMMVTAAGSLDVFVSRIDKSLVKSLKFLVEFQLPSTSNREILWKKLMPPALPLSEEINYRKLAEASSDFSVAHIGNAIYRSAATAALRKTSKERAVSMKDLFAAIEEEKTRGESAVDRWVKAQYI